MTLVPGGSGQAHGVSQTGGRPFAMNYAPHLGMFAQHAGTDPIDQIGFMADEGFLAMDRDQHSFLR